MIKKLKKSFITATMISVMAVMLLVTLVYNITTYIQIVKGLDKFNEMLIDNNNLFTNIPFDMKLTGNNFAKDDSYAIMRFFIVQYDRTGQGYITTKFITDISDDTTIQYATEVMKSKEQKGWKHQYYYKVKEIGGESFIIFLDASEIIKFVRNMVLISTIVWLSSSVLVFIISFFLSAKAVKPTVLALERQKQFITDASHELKTPLTVISADIEVLEMNNGVNEWSEDVKLRTKDMTKLVNQIVVLAKMDEYEENTVGNKRGDFCISDAVFDTAKVFSSMQQLTAKKELVIDIDSDIYMNGDEAMIRNLVSLLLDNAFKYCDDAGEITIKLKKQKRIKLSVRNTYENVSNLNLNLIFERFYRGDSARCANGSHGIGLAIARSIVEKHKGKISANNIDNRMIEVEVTF